MPRRRSLPLVLALLAATGLLATAAPAHAVTAFGPFVTVAPTRGTWTKATVAGSHSRMVPIVVSLSGRATVVMASAERLYARTQVS